VLLSRPVLTTRSEAGDLVPGMDDSRPPDSSAVGRAEGKKLAEESTSSGEGRGAKRQRAHGGESSREGTDLTKIEGPSSSGRRDGDESAGQKRGPGGGDSALSFQNLADVLCAAFPTKVAMRELLQELKAKNEAFKAVQLSRQADGGTNVEYSKEKIAASISSCRPGDVSAAGELLQWLIKERVLAKDRLKAAMDTVEMRHVTRDTTEQLCSRIITSWPRTSNGSSVAASASTSPKKIPRVWDKETEILKALVEEVRKGLPTYVDFKLPPNKN
jgi:hypothetical protein